MHPRRRSPAISRRPIDIDEGLRLFTNLVGSDPKLIKSGDPVELDFEELPDGDLLPVFVCLTNKPTLKNALSRLLAQNSSGDLFNRQLIQGLEPDRKAYQRSNREIPKGEACQLKKVIYTNYPCQRNPSL